MKNANDGITYPDFPKPTPVTTGYERAERKPDRIAKKHWQPTFTRRVEVRMLWHGVTYIFDVDAHNMTTLCGDVDAADWDPTSGHEIEFRGTRYAAIEPEYPAPSTCPEEPYRIAVEALRGVAHWMRAAGVDHWQIEHAWGAVRAQRAA